MEHEARSHEKHEHGDPIIGLAITLVILRITWQSWRTVSRSDPGEVIEAHEHSHWPDAGAGRF